MTFSDEDIQQSSPKIPSSWRGAERGGSTGNNRGARPKSGKQTIAIIRSLDAIKDQKKQNGPVRILKKKDEPNTRS